jgi:hypothetical protein
MKSCKLRAWVMLAGSIGILGSTSCRDTDTAWIDRAKALLLTPKSDRVAPSP